MSMICKDVHCGLRRRRLSSSCKESSPTLQYPHPVPSAQIHQTLQFDRPIGIDDLGKNKKSAVFSEQQSSGESSRTTSGSDSAAEMMMVPEVSLGWGRLYTLRELEVATDGFADENVIGEGVHGIVYHGILADKSLVAVRKLLNNREQAEKEFKVEVDTIGRARHKNLVRLLGYCVEGDYRMLVYEYVDNGNLEQWLHSDVGEFSPLTWETRTNIILGTAKGLAYLHEGLEPKLVHRDIKSRNILLDKKWNSKVSDFGVAKLFCAEGSYMTTGVMGTHGNVASEYACTGMLNEKSDVYSFGVLMMEVISGRMPVDHNRPPEEVNLVDWWMKMITEKRVAELVDPKMQGKPSSMALSLAILEAIRCVDLDAQQRPKMGRVVHMLEEDNFVVRVGRSHGF